MILHGLHGQVYQLETKAFSSGGEGDIYGIIGIPDKVVKVYHADRITNELEQKLNRMASNPPSSRVLSQVAWPLDVVYDSTNRFCGFVMPRLSITAELSEVYVYPPRTNITYQQKLILAQNICVVISEVHKAGYVFGDFNPRNIGINTNTGSVAFLDTDSYHIVIDKATNKAFRCNVCAPGYAAPELLEKCAQHLSLHPEDSKHAYAATPLDTFTKETDNFALAIHMFKLLMNGYTPFGGIKETESASVGSPGVGDAAVRRDSYCFKPGNKPQAAAIPPLETLPQEIADLFTRAFMYGRVDPKMRPSALEWHSALSNYEKSLKTCAKNPTHMYQRNLQTCPWCEADDRYKASIAPPIKQKNFVSPVTPTPVPRPANPSSTPSGTSGTGGYVGPNGINTAGRGGSTYIPPTPTASNQPSIFQQYKGWIIGAVVVLVLILLVSSCSSNKSVEILTDNLTLSVGETAQVRIMSSSREITANYNRDLIKWDWGTPKKKNGGYLIVAKLTALAPGDINLRIFLTGNESVSDSISVKITGSSNASGDGNEIYSEENDGSSPAEAIRLDANIAKQGSLRESRDIKWYVLTLENPGTVSFDMQYSEQDTRYSYWELNLYTANDSSNSVMSCYYYGQAEGFSNTVNSSSPLIGLDAGTYYLKISDGNYSTTDTYTLTATYTETTLCEMEPNGSYATASTLTLNQPHVGSLTSYGDDDWYVFTLDNAGTVTFNMQYPVQETRYSYWELYLYTVSDSSNSVMSCYYYGQAEGFSDAVNSSSPLVGLDAGTYYIKIIDGNYFTTDTYTLTAIYDETDFCELEPNGSYSMASPIIPNQSYVGSLTSYGDDDWYVLTLDNAYTVTFNMQYPLQETRYSYWELYMYSSNDSSNSMMKNYYYGTETNTNSPPISLNPGTYYIKIQDGNYFSTSTYTLTANVW